MKAYTTRVGEGPFPTELHDETGERIRRGRQGVRHRHRPPPALRLVRRGRGPLLGPGLGLDRAGRDAARRAQRDRSAAGRRRLRGRRRAAGSTRFPADLDDLARRAGRSSRTCPAGRPTSPGPGPGPTCRPRPATTSGSSAEQVGVPVRIVSVGPDREQTIQVDPDRRPGRSNAPADRTPPQAGTDACRPRPTTSEATRTRPTSACAPSSCPGTSPSSWTATAAGPRPRGLPRILGHRAGIRSVRAVVEEGCRLGLEQLTLYCFSSENWKRPARELRFLMRLLRHFLDRRARRADGSGRPADDDRPPRRPARGRARRVRPDRRP